MIFSKFLIVMLSSHMTWKLAHANLRWNYLLISPHTSVMPFGQLQELAGPFSEVPLENPGLSGKLIMSLSPAAEAEAEAEAEAATG